MGDREPQNKIMRNNHSATTGRQHKTATTRLGQNNNNIGHASTMFQSSLGSISSSSINIDIENKIACKFHPHKYLQAFCMSADCMLPMCSACIWQHSQEHQEHSVHKIGQFHSLNDVIQHAHSNVIASMRQLQQINEEYLQDYGSKDKNIEQCRKKLQDLRHTVLDRVDMVFRQAQAMLERTIIDYDSLMKKQYSLVEQKLHQNYKRLSKDEKILNYHSLSPSLSLQNKYNNSQFSTIKKLIKFYNKNEEQHNNQVISQLKKQITNLKHNNQLTLQINQTNILQAIQSIKVWITGEDMLKNRLINNNRHEDIKKEQKRSMMSIRATNINNGNQMSKMYIDDEDDQTSKSQTQQPLYVTNIDQRRQNALVSFRNSAKNKYQTPKIDNIQQNPLISGNYFLKRAQNQPPATPPTINHRYFSPPNTYTLNQPVIHKQSSPKIVNFPGAPF